MITLVNRHAEFRRMSAENELQYFRILYSTSLKWSHVTSLHLHLNNLFAKSYKDIQQIPVQGAKIKMSEYVCVAKVINNFGTIIMK